MRFDHVGIAVRNLDDAVRTYATIFAAQVVHREDLPQESVRLAFVDTGGVLLELLAPVGETGALARFLGSHGEGLHHLAFAVDDVTNALREAVAAGQRAVDDAPRRGSRGRLVAFLHPESAHGVLIELVQSA